MKWKIWLIFRKRGSLTTTLASPVVELGGEPAIVLDGEPVEPFSIPADERGGGAAQEAINGLYVTLDRQQRTQFSRVLEAVVAAQERRRTGAGMIAQERLRQIHEHGWDADHDAAYHTHGELVSAAIAYALTSPETKREAWGYWPFEPRFWKPSDDPLPNLIKAGALIAAEIDRLLRQKASNEQTEVHL